MRLIICLLLTLGLAPPAIAQVTDQDGNASDTAGDASTQPPAAAGDPVPLPPGLDDILDGQRSAAAEGMAATLARPEVRTRVLDLAMAQVRFPAPVLDPFRAALDALLQDAAARAALAATMHRQFDQFGIARPTDDQIFRVAATMLPGWALDGAAAGLSRLPVADLRAVLATRLAIAESLSPQRCDAYFSDWSPDASAIEMSAIAAMPPDSAAAVLRLMMAASLAEYRDDPPTDAMAAAVEDEARRTLGAAIMAAVDASSDPDRLIGALSPTAFADPADVCAARVLVLRAALDMPAPQGDLALRLIAAFGLDGGFRPARPPAP